MVTGTQKEIAALTDAGETERAKALAVSRLNELNTEIAARKERGEATDQLEREKAALAAVTQRLISAEGTAVDREKIAAEAPVRDATVERMTAEAEGTRAQTEWMGKQDPGMDQAIANIWADPTIPRDEKLRQVQALQDAKRGGQSLVGALTGEGRRRDHAQLTGADWMNNLNEDVSEVMSAQIEPRQKIQQLKSRGWTDRQIEQYARNWRPGYTVQGSGSLIPSIMPIGTTPFAIADFARQQIGERLGMTRNAFVKDWLQKSR
jgi:hypothetical protein